MRKRMGCDKMERGLLHIYCGDGKGKTTAAIGLAVRAAGCNRKILFARFLKTENSGELRILDQISEIKVIHLPKNFGFYKNLNEEERIEMRGMYQDVWNLIREEIQTGEYKMLVMDEFMAAYRYELVNKSEALEFLKGRPLDLEVVLTGRDPEMELLDIADYVSEIQKVKHPFDKGIIAREGIEY